MTSGSVLSGFGVAAGVFALFFFGDVPRVRVDILQRIPVVGGYWKREIAPEDNVCGCLSTCFFLSFFLFLGEADCSFQ